MPTYQYECGKCQSLKEVVKSVSALDEKEICPKCKNRAMDRIILSAPQISTSNCQFEAHMNHAFGKVVRNKRELQNEVKRHEGETGNKLYEVGNDKMTSIKRKRKEYTLD